MSSTISFGSSFPQGLTNIFPAPLLPQRAPGTSDVSFYLGQVWIDAPAGAVYILSSVSGGSANWLEYSSTASALNTLTGDSGGAISPSSNNITLAGTSDQITTTGSGHTITYSLSNTLVAPGTLASTTTLTAGTN